VRSVAVVVMPECAAIAAHSGITTTATERTQIAAFLTELNPGDPQPLPEPATWLALGGGAALLALLSRRRRIARR
jgi:hypothetical protein